MYQEQKFVRVRLDKPIYEQLKKQSDLFRVSMQQYLKSVLVSEVFKIVDGLAECREEKK